MAFGPERPTGRLDQLYGQRFDARGETLGVAAPLDGRGGELDRFLARSAILHDGSSVTIWNSGDTVPTRGDLDSKEIRARTAAPSGRPMRKDIHLALNYGTVGSIWGGNGMDYDAAALRYGEFVTVARNSDWTRGRGTEDRAYDTVMRFFDATGRPEGGPPGRRWQ